MGIILAILLFGFIIFIHELGHFAVARFNGIKVHEFSIGLGPTLIGKEFKGTKFSLKLLPFGGACMMGEDDEEGTDSSNFNNKSPWQRISVIAAGAGMNLLLALILSIITISWIGYRPPVVGGLMEDSPAAAVGVEAGDTITRMNGRRVRTFNDITLYNLMNLHGDPMDVTFIRNGETHHVTIEPKKVVEGESTRFLMGIISTTESVHPNFLGSVEYGFYNVQFWVSFTIQSLRMLIVGDVGADQLAGPVGIVSMVDDTYQATVDYGVGPVVLSFMWITILLSANLGVLNLLPLPALDGGRLVFLFLEVIRGKRLPPEKEGVVHFVGIVLLLILMVYVMSNDIRNLLI